MKRYDVESYNIEEHEIGDYILYEDFVNLILARIKELEAEIDNEDSNESEMSCMFKINELKRLIE